MDKWITTDESLFPNRVITEDDMMSEEELHEYLYGEWADEDDAWTEEILRYHGLPNKVN